MNGWAGGWVVLWLRRLALACSFISWFGRPVMHACMVVCMYYAGNFLIDVTVVFALTYIRSSCLFHVYWIALVMKITTARC